MDENSFDVDRDHLAEMARRFPAARHGAAPAPAPRGLDQLTGARGGEFADHAWDEGGHL